MRLFTISFLLGLAVGCGDEKKDKTSGRHPEPVATPDSLSIPPSTDTKISLNPNEVSPELVEVVQTKLGEIRYSFSKPIESIRNKNFDTSLIHQSWADDRQTYILTFDPVKVKEKSFTTIILSGLIGEFGRMNNNEFKFDIDNKAPEIKAVEILDNTSIKVTFTESANLTKSKFNINNVAAGDFVSAEGPFATIRFNSINLTGDVSYKLTISDVSDVLGNSVEESIKVFTKSVDTQAPKIKSVKQLEYQGSPSSPMLKFEIEFDEYTQDKRDLDPIDTTITGLQVLQRYTKSFKINGKDFELEDSIWTPRADHLGGLLFVDNSPDIFTDGETSTVALILTDLSGNSESSTFSLMVQSRAPHLVNIEDDRPCKMLDPMTMQCAVSRPGAVSAALLPYGSWVSVEYQVTSLIDLKTPENPNRLEFKFSENIPERYIEGVQVIDTLKNKTEYELTGFVPTSKVSKVTEVLVASPRAIEVLFDTQIVTIGEVIVDGQSVEFTKVIANPSYFSFKITSAVIYFKEALSTGPHRIELKGVHVADYAVSPSATLFTEVDVSDDSKILATSLNDFRNLQTENDYYFETTFLIKEDDLELYHYEKIDQSITRSPFKEYELTRVATLDNSFLYKIVKRSSEGLKPATMFSEQLILKLRGQREIGPIRANWVKIEPALIP